MLDQLLEILPVPAEPVDRGTRDLWQETEQSLGLLLPSDYKEFINTYGTGEIDDFLAVLNPFTKIKRLNLIKGITDILEVYRKLKQSYPEDFPFETYPTTNGLLPWGTTANGDRLYWLTSGSSEEWPIVSYERGEYYEIHNLSMTAYLVKLLTGKLQTRLFPDDFKEQTSHNFACRNT